MQKKKKKTKNKKQKTKTKRQYKKNVRETYSEFWLTQFDYILKKKPKSTTKY